MSGSRTRTGDGCFFILSHEPPTWSPSKTSWNLLNPAAEAMSLGKEWINETPQKAGLVLLWESKDLLVPGRGSGRLFEPMKSEKVDGEAAGDLPPGEAG